MNFRLAAFSVTFAALTAAVGAYPQNVRVPASSAHKTGDPASRMYTHYLINTDPPRNWSDPTPMAMMPDHGPSLFRMFSSPPGFHPADIRTAYAVSGNGGGAIAIVDAFDFATALSDFNTFSSTFGLPQETSTNPTASTNKVLQVIYASGTKPATNLSWNGEEALDIEWAHAMAPNAKIYLIESTDSNSLFTGVAVASALAGVTQESNSWGSDGEYSGEAQSDSYFSNSNITYYASTGDFPSVRSYPSLSSKVVGVGGTSLFLTSSGTYGHESGWSDAGGGPSTMIARPTFQNGISSIVGSFRGAPDIGAVADPNTGVAVYDTGYGGWVVFGGTSVACPVCAGIANQIGAKRGSGELSYIYSNTSNFRDVTLGGTTSFHCMAGWDFVTGWGSPLGFATKTATVNPNGASIYSGQGTGASGSYINLSQHDLSYYSIESVPSSAGQVAAAQVNYTVPSTELQGLQRIVFNLYLNGPATATNFIYLYNLSTQQYDLVASPALTGTDSNYTFTLNSSNSNFPNYVNLNTGAVTMIDRAVVPSRFGSSRYYLQLDQAVLNLTY